MNRKRVARELLKLARELQAMPMLVHETVVKQRLPIADKLRAACGIQERIRPTFSRYMTFKNERSNKFHYFAVYKNPDDPEEYIGGNAWGRIGYMKTGRAMELARGDRASVIKAIESKIKKKLSKGYEFDTYSAR